MPEHLRPERHTEAAPDTLRKKTLLAQGSELRCGDCNSRQPNLPNQAQCIAEDCLREWRYIFIIGSDKNTHDYPRLREITNPDIESVEIAADTIALRGFTSLFAVENDEETVVAPPLFDDSAPKHF